MYSFIPGFVILGASMPLWRGDGFGATKTIPSEASGRQARKTLRFTKAFNRISSQAFCEIRITVHAHRFSLVDVVLCHGLSWFNINWLFEQEF